MFRSPFSVFQYLIIATICVLATVHASAATITVPAGGSLQSAINAAQPGDTIILQAGVTYAGDFSLPNKSGTNFITIQSSRIAELPEGVRVGPAQSALFAKLVSVHNGEPVIKTTAGSHHYRFIGLEMSPPSPSTVIYNLVRLGDSPQTAADVPHNIVIDRSYIHGFPTQDVQRGIALNGADITISNSHISDIHGRGYDTQAIGAWNGPGPFRIINNYLEAAGENIMFGGSLPSITNLVPSNIEIRRNHLFKPLSWKVGHPTYAGIHWTVKNLLEFKNARNVIVDGNVMENCWTDGQIGYAVLFTVRSEEGRAPWATIENVSFTNNTIRNTEQGIQMLGTDYPYQSGRGNGVLIANNLFTGIVNRFLTMSGFYNVEFDHNTHFQGGNVMILHGEDSIGFTYTNNITTKSGYGFFGDGVGEGNIALINYTPSAVFQRNLIAG
ncbi:MAG TPA: right-handed parallel beta-helix repeat-containing protein, partial [Pyrinomonadaceae bacterium]|nr:right-handed parallel beta-helix repeat-containing protein [Pyrinomonadaceae bacterium]